jgi:hypothetical protein
VPRLPALWEWHYWTEGDRFAGAGAASERSICAIPSRRPAAQIDGSSAVAGAALFTGAAPEATTELIEFADRGHALTVDAVAARSRTPGGSG